MLTYYFDIKNEDILPQGAIFKDPYDKNIFRVKAGETLPNFIKRIQESREEKKYRPILDTDLRQLVIDSLVMSMNKNHVRTYFTQRTAFPTMQSILAFITTLAYELVNSNGVSVKQQEERLDNCLDDCAFHKPPGMLNFSNATNKLINKVVGFVSATDLRKTRQELENEPIGNCAMCGGCNLLEKKKFTASGVLAGLTPDALDRILRVYGPKAFGRCWQLRECIEDPKLKPIMISKLERTSVNGPELLKQYESATKRKRNNNDES